MYSILQAVLPPVETAIHFVRYLARVGELLPTASLTTNGLLSKSDYKVLSKSYNVTGSKLYKILDLTNSGDWLRSSFAVTTISDTGASSQYYNSTYKVDSVLNVVTKKTSSGGPSLKIYKKGYSVYIYTDWTSVTNYMIHVQSNYPLVLEGVLDDTYTLVDIQS